MKKYSILLFIVFASAIVYSQDYNISFVGAGASTTVDSIQVKNLKKGTSLSLLGNDVLHLYKFVGIQNMNPVQENVIVYPNPMQEQAELIFNAKEEGNIQVTIYNISGKKVASSNLNLTNGQHKFMIKGLKEGLYVVKVNGEHYQYKAMLSCINNSQNLPSISYIGYVKANDNLVLKTNLSIINMAYTTGDSIRYTGYSGILKTIITEVPTASKTITFTFISKLPILTTTKVTRNTDSSAISGGNITSDGGFPVTARGVCWGTAKNPDITGYHTTDGTGTGVFTSSLVGLKLGNIYYVRSYATNSAGTSYGNEVIYTFTLVPGDSFQGGIVAYIFQPGDSGYIAGQVHGLIAAKSNQGALKGWGCHGVPLTGSDGTAIGTGEQNTIDIITGCKEPAIAAKLCYDLVLGGYNDWHLPSKDELNILYLNKDVIGGFATDLYWSSSENSFDRSWCQAFYSGEQMANYKKNGLYVRAVRYF